MEIWWGALFCDWPGKPVPTLNARRWRAVLASLSPSSLEASIEALASAGQWEAAAYLRDPELLLQADAMLAKRAAIGWHPLFPGISNSFPAQLLASPDCPPALFSSAQVPPGPGIAIVGSRELTPEEERFAWEAGAACVEGGFAVISGAARGADTAAANACRSAGSVPIEFLPGGGTPHEQSLSISRNPDLPAFVRLEALMRNRYIYGSAIAAVVVASRFQEGGSWHSALAARRAHQPPVFVYMGSKPSSGNAALAKLGVPAVQSGAEVLQRVRDKKPVEHSLAI